jgi:hypothetical protein
LVYKIWIPFSRNNALRATTVQGLSIDGHAC